MIHATPGNFGEYIPDEVVLLGILKKIKSYKSCNYSYLCVCCQLMSEESTSGSPQLSQSHMEQVHDMMADAMRESGGSDSQHSSDSKYLHITVTVTCKVTIQALHMGHMVND